MCHAWRQRIYGIRHVTSIIALIYTWRACGIRISILFNDYCNSSWLRLNAIESWRLQLGAKMASNVHSNTRTWWNWYFLFASSIDMWRIFQILLCSVAFYHEIHVPLCILHTALRSENNVTGRSASHVASKAILDLRSWGSSSRTKCHLGEGSYQVSSFKGKTKKDKEGTLPPTKNIRNRISNKRNSYSIIWCIHAMKGYEGISYWTIYHCRDLN